MDPKDKKRLKELDKLGKEMKAEINNEPDVSEFEPTVGDQRLAHIIVPDREFIFHTEAAFGLKDGFLPTGETCILAAPGGCGKTYLLLQAAIAASCGISWLHAKALKPIKVLYLAAEENQDELARRFQSVLKSMSLYEQPYLINLLDQNLRLLTRLGKNERFINDKGETTEVFTKLKFFLEKYPDIKLVILDPASKYMGSEVEKDNAKAQDWINLLSQLTLTKGKPSILITHHTRKDLNGGKGVFKNDEKDKVPDLDADSIRGSGGIVAGFRWAMILARRRYEDNSEKVFLRVVKTNYSKQSGTLQFEPDPNNSGILKFKGETQEKTKSEFHLPKPPGYDELMKEYERQKREPVSEVKRDRTQPLTGHEIDII